VFSYTSASVLSKGFRRVFFRAEGLWEKGMDRPGEEAVNWATAAISIAIIRQEGGS